ncbi:hypothetical protein BHE74_00032874, partial [Ensete ventricosum]
GLLAHRWHTAATTGQARNAVPLRFGLWRFANVRSTASVFLSPQRIGLLVLRFLSSSEEGRANAVASSAGSDIRIVRHNVDFRDLGWLVQFYTSVSSLGISGGWYGFRCQRYLSGSRVAGMVLDAGIVSWDLRWSVWLGGRRVSGC